MLSKHESSRVSDQIDFKAQHPDFLDVIVEVGNECGLEARDKTLNVRPGGMIDVTLESSSSVLSGLLISKYDSTSISLYSTDGGKSWACRATVSGNFGANDSNAAQNAWLEFKAKLIEKAKKKYTDEQIV